MNRTLPLLVALAGMLATRHWCNQYEWNGHVPYALKAGMAQTVIDAIGEGRRPLQAFRNHGRGDRRAGTPVGEVTEEKMAVRVAINGFGRIGRNVLRAIIESGRKDIEVVAINDLGPVETNAHLLRYDSVHGRFPAQVSVDGEYMIAAGHKMKVTAIKNPAELPHKAETF